MSRKRRNVTGPPKRVVGHYAGVLTVRQLLRCCRLQKRFWGTVAFGIGILMPWEDATGFLDSQPTVTVVERSRTATVPNGSRV